MDDQVEFTVDEWRTIIICCEYVKSTVALSLAERIRVTIFPQERAKQQAFAQGCESYGSFQATGYNISQEVTR